LVGYPEESFRWWTGYSLLAEQSELCGSNCSIVVLILGTKFIEPIGAQTAECGQPFHVDSVGLEFAFLQTHIEPQTTNFVGENVEASWCTGFQRVLALDHRFVDLGTTFDVVALDR
jgi:hypothetical protein